MRWIAAKEHEGTHYISIVWDVNVEGATAETIVIGRGDAAKVVAEMLVREFLRKFEDYKPQSEHPLLGK